MDLLLLVLVILLCYVAYETYKNGAMPHFAVAAIEKTKQFVQWVISKLQTKKEGE